MIRNLSYLEWVSTVLFAMFPKKMINITAQYLQFIQKCMCIGKTLCHCGLLSMNLSHISQGFFLRTGSIWASYQIRKIAGCACAGNGGNVSPRRQFQRKPLVSDPGMHHGTCVTHVPWCTSGSLTCDDGENVPGIPGACAPAILRIWQEAHCIWSGARVSPLWPVLLTWFSFNSSMDAQSLKQPLTFRNG